VVEDSAHALVRHNLHNFAQTHHISQAHQNATMEKDNVPDDPAAALIDPETIKTILVTLSEDIGNLNDSKDNDATAMLLANEIMAAQRVERDRLLAWQVAEATTGEVDIDQITVKQILEPIGDEAEEERTEVGTRREMTAISESWVLLELEESNESFGDEHDSEDDGRAAERQLLAEEAEWLEVRDAASTTSLKRKRGEPCVACLDETDVNAFVAPCGCRYCGECVSGSVSMHIFFTT
jgi:hypothetical protein